MSDETFDISILGSDAELVAVVVPHESLFGLLRRSLSVPAGWMALVTGGDGRASTVSPGREIEASGTADVTFVRSGALPLAFEIGQVSSSDGYLCDGSLRLSVSLPNEAADLAAFRSSVIGTGHRATLSSLRQYLAGHVQQGVAAWAGGQDAASLVDGRQCDESLDGAIREATKPVCFSAGLRLTGETAGRFQSGAFRTVRDEAQRATVQQERLALERQLREAAEASRLEHLEHVEQMLVQLQEMAAASPDVSVGELIRQFGQDERGQLYRSLSRSVGSTGRCEWLVVAAGNELVWLDPNAPDRPGRRQRIEVPGGAIRSVRLVVGAEGERLLAVGGMSAAVLMDAGTGEIRSTLTWELPGETSVRGGINSIALSDDALVATHSELGARVWRLETPDVSQPLLDDLTRGAGVVRHAQTDPHGHLWLSIDATVIRLAGDDPLAGTPTTYTGSTAPISSLVAVDGAVYAGNERGQVVHWSIDHPDRCEIVYAGGKGQCRSLSMTTATGIARLGLTDDSDAVKELIVGDTVVDRYVAGGDRLKQAWWAGDRIAAVNDQRSRLYVWRVGRPDAPSGVADIGHLCSNRAQDVCAFAASEAAVT